MKLTEIPWTKDEDGTLCQIHEFNLFNNNNLESFSNLVLPKNGIWYQKNYKKDAILTFQNNLNNVERGG